MFSFQFGRYTSTVLSFIMTMAASAAMMQGRIFLITGATDGIGKHTATKLAQTGATVFLHGRSRTKLDKTVQEIKQQTNNANLTGFLADFSSLAEVRKLSEEVHQKCTHLDVLINNAGVFMETRQESTDGHEMTFAVNVLAPFLLSSLLLDLLKKGTSSRIVNVSSISLASTIDFNNLQLTKGYGNGHKAYELSKLSDIMFTFEMAEMLKNCGVTVNCLDPGTVNTKMLLQGWGPCGIEISDADNEFHLATDAKYDNVTGKYFVNLRERKPSSIAYDRDARRRFWDILVEMTGAQF